MRHIYVLGLLILILNSQGISQVVINEGSNRNYSVLPDENGEYPDWVELYNMGAQPVNLLNYALTDNPSKPSKWKFPDVTIGSHEFLTVFCSGKDRKPLSGFVHVRTVSNFTPQVGWNNHNFTTPFYWDGISNILINTCSYSSTGYTSNSVFNQSATSYYSSSFYVLDGSEGACSFTYGNRSMQRPNMKFNGHIVGTGQIQNSPTDYPAPYGNWYWNARHQMLITAQELTAAGLTAGNINSLAFDVASTDPNTVYDYIDIYMNLVNVVELTGEFIAVDTNNYKHTNFKISEDGESVYIFSPEQSMLSELYVNCGDLDNSSGLSPDGSQNTYIFANATPSSSNNQSPTYTEYLQQPVFSVGSGIYHDPLSVSITNPNPGVSSVHYTFDGSEPTPLSTLYTSPLQILYPCVLKARVFSADKLPSQNRVASYLFDVTHSTPIISVITDPVNLFGPTGIFDNWWSDWEKAAYIEYFDTAQNLIFTQKSGMQMDGGWGGSRTHPQHSFRLEPGNGILGEGPIEYPLIPGRPYRTTYSKLYLRNGSNQFLVLPYKEGYQAEAMAASTHHYYSALTPVSVYLNGYYFGLYELREKVDAEYFKIYDDADEDQLDLLSLSAWYGYVLRAVEGSVNGFFNDYQSFTQLNPPDTGYWNSASRYFDLEWYTDYIIAESWMANTDWPHNNIKIYRSDATDYSWRFLVNDMELGLSPNSWTDCYFDHIAFMLGQDPNNMFINIWLRSIQNQKYKNYFINRFADLMNSAYKYDSLSIKENHFYNSFLPEMPKEYARWGDPNNIPGQMNGFIDNHNIFNSQLELRSQEVRNHLQYNFNLFGQIDVTLDVYPPGSGKINISTITPGVYPWQGVYFNGVPIQIEALPAPGYSFLHWSTNGQISDTLSPIFNGMLGSENIAFTAYFDPTSIDVEDQPLQQLSIYPNPATQVLYVKGQNNGSVLYYSVTDLNGRVIMQQKLPVGKEVSAINISSLNKGIYNLHVWSTADFDNNFRFIKL